MDGQLQSPFVQLLPNEMEQTGPLENLPEMLQSVTSNQVLKMIFNQASATINEPEPLKGSQLLPKHYLNYPYPRATDQVGASIATLGYMMKETPRKLS